MLKKVLVAGIIAAITATPAFAESASREEGVGVGLGATIGGIAGGPVGIIVGAALGAKIGDEMHERDAEAERLAMSLADSEREVDQLQRNINSLDGDLRQLQAESRPELLSLLQAGIEMDLLFRTDEHVLAAGTESRLGQLAAGLATMPDVFVRLDGYADERGDAEYNRKLSVRRAEHVRDVLLANGVPAARIDVVAHGESPASDENIDSFALERKVSLTLFVDSSPAFASNPN